MAEIIRGTGQMAKGLTIAAMAIAVLMLVLFGLDLVLGIPFKGHSMLLDIIFVVCGVVIALLGFTTWRELE